MLRAFTGTGIRLGTMNRDRLMRASGHILAALTMFILCRLRPVMDLAPFATAFFAGALAAGGSCGALLAGGLIGSVRGMPVRMDLTVPAGAAIVLGGGLAWDSLRRRLRLGTSPPGGRDVFSCGVLAGLGALFPGLVAAEGSLWPSAQAVACAIAASASAPFFRVAMDIRRPRRFLLKEERIGLMLLLSGVTGGLASVYPPLAAGFGALAALTLHGSGSLAAIALGAGILLACGDIRMMGILCLCGMCAQLLTDERKLCRGGAAMLTMFAGALFLRLDMRIMAGAVLGAGVYALLPERWLALPEALAAPGRAACDPDRLAAQLRDRSVRRLTALSKAFGDLAECYLTPCENTDEQYLIGKMRDRLCAGCPAYERCWDSGSSAARFLCGLVSDAVRWAGSGEGGGLFEEDMPPDVIRMCRRGRLVPERLENMLTDFALRRQSEKRRGSENRLISAQFLQAKQLLEGLAEEQSRPIRLRNRQSRRAAAILEGMGIPLSEVMALGEPRVEMIAVLKEGQWSREMAEAASARLTRSFGRLYRPEGEGGREMRFVRSPCYSAETGAGCVSCEAGMPSGDSHLVKMIDDDRMLVLICDGMGSGEAAARESAAAVKLLARFLCAGVRVPLAVETVNAMLLSRSSDDMFATVDMLILDLATGTAEFIKMAACPSLIARDGEIFRVEGGRLPLGILEKAQPAVTRVRLMPGDIVLMASDGVMDAVDTEVLFENLSAGTENMPDLAQRVLALAENDRQRCRRDDMTAICLRVTDRERLDRAI